MSCEAAEAEFVRLFKETVFNLKERGLASGRSQDTDSGI